jgi:glycosyltransferase involved in cell wall biosynthesis
MKIGFLIGVNDVGGAEYVSYQHVVMARRNGFEVVVLSGSEGRFYELICALDVKCVLVGMAPKIEVMRELLLGCDAVFNCNSFGMAQQAIDLKKEGDHIGSPIRYGTIIHSNIHWVYEQVSKFDQETDLYYAIHQKIADEFIIRNYEFGITNSESKFRVIPNCVDVNAVRRDITLRDQIRQSFKFKTDEIVLGMVTRVAADKNILDAIRILSDLRRSKNEYRNSKLLIIGGESELPGSKYYLQKVTSLVSYLGQRNHVIITGMVGQDEVYKYIHAIDIGLNCSPSEGLPIALLEMMAAGKPCVFPSIGEIPEVLGGKNYELGITNYEAVRGIVVPIRQRLTVREIQAERCYSPQEIRLFVESISGMDLRQRLMYGELAENYIEANRSLGYQEKEFVKFLNELTMKSEKLKVKSEKLKVHAKAQNEDANSAEVESATNANEGIMELKNGRKFPKVSVLMPVRDTPDGQIIEAVLSIMEQDYINHAELELMIVVHNCRLSTMKMLKTFTENKMPLELHLIMIEKDDVTFAEALDLGLKECSGDIVVRMDSDDIAMPNLVSKIVDYMEANPEVPVCGVQLEFFGAKQMLTNHPMVITRKSAYETAGHWFVNHPGAGMRKKEILELGGYGNTPTGLSEDYALWCKVLKNGHEIHNLPDVLVKYRSVQKPWRYTDGWREFLIKEKEQLRIRN